MTLTFTFDLEDHRVDNTYPKRYPDITRELLNFLAQKQIRGTFFVVGEIATSEPELIKNIFDQGHEIAFHTMSHLPLNRDEQSNFAKELHRGKLLLEEITGSPVKGFRAPVFSLTQQTTWCLDILKDQGFIYSSSILPARNILHGFPGAPETPFHWKNGLIEIPVPVSRFFGLTFPFLGGIYLRYLPKFLLEYFLKQQPRNARLWSYFHPYDFDTDEPLGPMKETALWVSTLLWFNRKRSWKMLEHLIYLMSKTQSEYLPFIEQINQGEYDNLPRFKY